MCLCVRVCVCVCVRVCAVGVGFTEVLIALVMGRGPNHCVVAFSALPPSSSAEFSCEHKFMNGDATKGMPRRRKERALGRKEKEKRQQTRKEEDIRQVKQVHRYILRDPGIPVLLRSSQIREQRRPDEFAG